MSVKYFPKDYQGSDKLYVGYKNPDHLDEYGKIKVNSIRFPDFSCNWSKFSEPKDINLIDGMEADGCYSISVDTARYKRMATTCHDPLGNNFSHTEIRQLMDGEDLSFEPPQNRKLRSGNWSRSMRKEYRQNIVNKHQIEIEAKNLN